MCLGRDVAESGSSTPGINKVTASAPKQATKDPFGTSDQKTSFAQNWFDNFVCGSNAALYEPFGEV